MAGLINNGANNGVIKPRIEELNLKGNLKSSLDNLVNSMKPIKTLIIKKTDKNIILISIDSRDIQKNPFLFVVITIEPDHLKIQYSVPQDNSEKLRRLYVIRLLLNILSLIGDNYSVDPITLYSYINLSVDDILTSMTQSYSSLFNSYDSLFSESRELKKLNATLQESNKELSAKAVELSNENRVIKQQLNELQKYSDESLMIMVENWIEEHHNTLDLEEFSKNYNLTIQRVENILNKMVGEGYISLQG